MRMLAIGVAAAMAIMFTTSAADAAPLGLAPVPAVAHGQEAGLVLVRGRCGFGEHRTYSGYCRYNRGWRGRARFHRNHWRRHWY